MREIQRKLNKFLAKTPRARYAALARMWLAKFPSVPVPYRLPFGAWWLARPGRIDERLLEGDFEAAELQFVESYLQPGMTVLDIGGHHGLYALLASKRVGEKGRVFTFEPSLRERVFLNQHLRLNGCSNVTVESVALSSEVGEAKLFLVEGREDGCNSLRPPVDVEKTTPLEVQLAPLDKWLEARSNPKIDFIKLDVEGGELEVLRGAHALLERGQRPVIFVEIQDIRTQPWGYAAREIALELHAHQFRLFQIVERGNLVCIPCDLPLYDGNFVGCPEDRLDAIQQFVVGGVGA